MPVITLTTDFGIQDEYAGVVKGVILGICPEARIIDLTHQIPPQDIRSAGALICSAYPFFPPETIHVVVVDPGVGGTRAIIALALDGYRFLAPDNGVLSPVLAQSTPTEIVSVEESAFFRKPVSHTFHGRDIFAPVAAHMAKGIDLLQLGPRRQVHDLIYFTDEKPAISKNGELIGQIVASDRFGNLITNIDFNTLNSFCKHDRDKTLEIWIAQERVTAQAANYAAVEPHKALALIGSRNYLEIAINQGNAQAHFKAQPGDKIRVVLKKAGSHNRKL